MSLELKLQQEGSKFSYNADGATPTPQPSTFVPTPNLLGSNQSTLHADPNGNPGYSLTGNGGAMSGVINGQNVSQTFSQAAILYKDGNNTNDMPAVNPALQASDLDLEGTVPTFASHGATGVPGISNQALPYGNNLPPGGVI
jgi:hypothetical protein